MGSMIELNDTLQITTEQGFPIDLDYEKHLLRPLTEHTFKDKTFAFHGKKNIRIFHAPPVRVFLAHNINGKWLYWGRVEIIELTLDYKGQTTSGKFIITKLFSPEEMQLAEIILNGNQDTNYFDPLKRVDGRSSENDRESKKDEELFSTEETIRFKYVNWQGETGIRTVKPIRLWFGTTEFHKGKHWFLKALDIDKNAERDYAIEDIIKIYPVKQPATISASPQLINEIVL